MCHFGSQFAGTVHHGKGRMAETEASWSHCIHSQEAERDERWGSAQLFPFAQTIKSMHGTALSEGCSSISMNLN